MEADDLGQADLALEDAYRRIPQDAGRSDPDRR
jgi:hypothetical protein